MNRINLLLLVRVVPHALWLRLSSHFRPALHKEEVVFLLRCSLYLPLSFAVCHPFVSPCLFQPRPHSFNASVCAVMKISQPAAHIGLPTSGAQTPQILPQAANPGVKPLMLPTPFYPQTSHTLSWSGSFRQTHKHDQYAALEAKKLNWPLIRLGWF